VHCIEVLTTIPPHDKPYKVERYFGVLSEIHVASSESSKTGDVFPFVLKVIGQGRSTRKQEYCYCDKTCVIINDAYTHTDLQNEWKYFTE